MTTLEGIQVENFAHPDEIKALQKLKDVKLVKKALDWLADKENQFKLKTTILGKCVSVAPGDMPELYGIVEAVCETLDYKPLPRIYTYHSPKFDIGIYAGNPALLIIPDFLLGEFDEQMLKFQIGRAITALKADTCQMIMLAEVVLGASCFIPIPVVGEMAFELIAEWMRKNGLTQDRGGLLACQDMNVAAKVLMRMAGMPLKFLDSSCIVEYLQIYQDKPVLSVMGQLQQTITRIECWNNDRIVNLYKWYISGEYDDLIEEYEEF